MPDAVNPVVDPTNNVGFDGATAMETSTGAVTVSVVDVLIAPDVAEIVVGPALRPDASPTASMVATEVAEEPQLTDEVRF